MKTVLGGTTRSANGWIIEPIGTPVFVAFCSNLLMPRYDNSSAENTVESKAQVRFPAGVLSSFSISCGANFSPTLSVTVTLRVNGVDTQLSKVFPPGFEQGRVVLPGAVSLNDGDLVSVSVTKTAGSAGAKFPLGAFGAFFDDGTVDTCTQILAAANVGSTAQVTLNDASTTYYGAFAGQIDTSGSIAEADVEVEQLRDTTASKMYVSVNANTRVSDTILRSRVNGANGNLVTTIGAGLTGNFLDASNEDELEAGDTFNYAITNGAGAGDLAANLIEVIAASIDGSIALSGREDTESFYYQDATFGVYSIHGSIGGSFDESTYITFPFAARLSNFILYVTDNTCDADVDFYINKNDDAETVFVFTVPAMTSGVFTQNIEEVELAVNDSVYLYAESADGPGEIALSYFSCRVDEIFDSPSSPSLGSPGIFGGADLSRQIKVNPNL